MPWTETTRLKYSRGQLRYASDTTGEEWALIAPYMPPPRPLGHPRTTNLRLFVDAVFYVAAPDRRWRTLPKDFPPYSTVQNYFYPWREDGTWECINQALVMGRVNPRVARPVRPPELCAPSPARRPCGSAPRRGSAFRASLVARADRPPFTS